MHLIGSRTTEMTTVSLIDTDSQRIMAWKSMQLEMQSV
jgi:hypothetical protein